MQRYWGVGMGVLCLLGRAQAADSYLTYENARFGYVALYPANLVTPGREADNGDGRVFKSRDSKVKLTVWGENNVFNRSLGAQMNAAKRDWAKDHARVTYSRLGNGFYALSGFTGQEIFYEKTVPIKGGFATILWQYPPSKKGVLSDAVTRTTRAFGSTRRRMRVPLAASPATLSPSGQPLAPRIALNAGKSAPPSTDSSEDEAQGY